MRLDAAPHLYYTVVVYGVVHAPRIGVGSLWRATVETPP